jgi:hypothetical protein
MVQNILETTLLSVMAGATYVLADKKIDSGLAFLACDTYLISYHERLQRRLKSVLKKYQEKRATREAAYALQCEICLQEVINECELSGSNPEIDFFRDIARELTGSICANHNQTKHRIY